MDDKLREEINRRRTFAIISHPDAGKTTLTEKFLLFGGAINTAGSVKEKANSKYAVSDWMDIEKERGISVTSSVLQFNYDGYCINILDLREAMGRLCDREKNIVRLRFFEGKTQTEVAEEISISQAQVSRLEKNAIKSLRRYLEDK